MNGFLLKKIVARFLFPLPLSLAMLVSGILLLWFTRKHRAGRILVTSGTVLLLLLSYSFCSEYLLDGLEERYTPVSHPVGGADMPAYNDSFVKWIVVLGGGHEADLKIPLSSRLSYATLVRLIEAIHLYRTFPSCKIILSGGGFNSPVTDAELMAQVAQMLGVPEKDLVLEAESWDTEDEARLIKPLVGTDPFFLVTSASHMWRSMYLFQNEGMHPVPAPTDYLVKDEEVDFMRYDRLFPQPMELEKATRAWYEYMGLGWVKVKETIKKAF